MVTAETIAIRPCEECDLDHFGAFGSDRHVEYCRDEFAHSGRVILVAVSDQDIPVGKVHVHLDRDDSAWLEALAVARPHRGRGIGATLVGAAEALAAERGFGMVALGVEDSNPGARQLYDRLGYRSVARSDFRYEGAPVPNPGVIMSKVLA
ncbi:MAG TPA: GNAT family N-acetyltransferase [Gaiellaceae bacterium]|nr:GNAT family N-acetyltransferase [Gaiellaceae bacterium]